MATLTGRDLGIGSCGPTEAATWNPTVEGSQSDGTCMGAYREI